MPGWQLQVSLAYALLLNRFGNAFPYCKVLSGIWECSLAGKERSTASSRTM